MTQAAAKHGDLNSRLSYAEALTSEKASKLGTLKIEIRYMHWSFDPFWFLGGFFALCFLQFCFNFVFINLSFLIVIFPCSMAELYLQFYTLFLAFIKFCICDAADKSFLFKLINFLLCFKKSTFFFFLIIFRTLFSSLFHTVSYLGPWSHIKDSIRHVPLTAGLTFTSGVIKFDYVEKQTETHE